jgi:hypothetical protein
VGHGIAPLCARATTISIMMRKSENVTKVPSRAQEDRGGCSDEPKNEDKTMQKTKTIFNERKKGNHGNM